MSAKTYYVGDAGAIRRLDNVDVIGAPPHVWVDINLPPSLYPNQPAPFLNDIKTDPTDPEKVFVVGGLNSLYKGIAYSADAGTNWVIPNQSATILALTATHKWYEVWPVNTDYVYVSGDRGIIAYTSDGGLNFDTLATTVQVGANPVNLYSIHFLAPVVGNPMFGVVGTQNYVLKTIDGGTVWNVLNSGNQIPIDEILGIYMSDDQQLIIAVGRSGIARSSNGGTTFQVVHNFPQREGRHLTWAGTTFWATGTNSIILKSTDQGQTWIPVPAPAAGDYLAAHFISNTVGFYGVTKNNPYNSMYYTDNVATTLSEDSPNYIKTIYAVWTSILAPTCYRLTSCSTGDSYVVGNDLSAYIGGVIRWSIFDDSNPPNVTALPGCWTVQISNTCVNAITTYTVDADYADCSECQDRCFILINCQDPTDYILTTSFTSNNQVLDPTLLLHKVIRLTGCPGKCYYISQSNLCDEAAPFLVIDLTNLYNDCTVCLATETDDTIVLNSRRIKPGFYTPGCPPAYTTKVNCKFSEGVFDEMAVIRYGITVCCDHDDILKWRIKKWLLDLNAIYDPDLCANSVQPCTKPCNVTSSINTYEVTEVVDPVPPAPVCDKPGPDSPVVTFGFT